MRNFDSLKTFIIILTIVFIVINLGFSYLPSAVIASFLLVICHYFFVDGSAGSFSFLSGIIFIVAGAVILLLAKQRAEMYGLTLEELSNSLKFMPRTGSMPFLGAFFLFSGLLQLILAWVTRD